MTVKAMTQYHMHTHGQPVVPMVTCARYDGQEYWRLELRCGGQTVMVHVSDAAAMNQLRGDIYATPTRLAGS